ncbi:MAG: hypothetical protein ABIW47_07905 [Ginsengibacter sp.]|jgi:hypothetical protein
MKKVIIPGLITGVVLFILSYGGLWLAVQFFPSLFIEYNNPLFSSDGERDVLFYMHAFIISMALSWFWAKFKGIFHGPLVIKALHFGLVYVLIAILPIMWITFSAMDITIAMVSSWLLYGFIQAVISGMILAKLNPSVSHTA